MMIDLNPFKDPNATYERRKGVKSINKDWRNQVLIFAIMLVVSVVAAFLI